MLKQLGAGEQIALELQGDICELLLCVGVPKFPRYFHFILHPDLAIFHLERHIYTGDTLQGQTL